jgi:hypothetical protein
MISSAHRRSGLLYSRWSRYYGKAEDDVLVVKGTTLDFNPSFDRFEMPIREPRPRHQFPECLPSKCRSENYCHFIR